MTLESQTGARTRTRTRTRALARQIASVAVAASLALAARSVLADHYVVPSGSMLPTIATGDRIVVDKLAYGLRLPFSTVWLRRGPEPRVGDVVVLVSPESGIMLLKRVAAVPGDTVEVVAGQVVIAGEAVPIEVTPSGLVETLGAVRHAVSLAGDGTRELGPLVVPAGRYLVLGDNRPDSRDGRVFGLVAREAILGRAVARYWGGGHFAWSRL
jgi:signal peptidase I